MSHAEAQRRKGRNENGRDLASGKTNLPLSTSPPQCLYLWEDLINLNFYPGESANDDLME